MIKRICDWCGGDKNVIEIYDAVFVNLAEDDNQIIFSFNLSDEELCEECIQKLKIDFLKAYNKRKKEATKK